MRQFATLVSLVLLIFFVVDNVQSFGFIGHQITADIAQRLLNPQAKRAVLELLPVEAGGNLSYIAPWADTIRRDPRYRFSSRLHFWNPAGNNPPKECIAEWREGGIDVISAIFNYTNRLNPASGLEYEQRAEALKFLVHFVGDLHQPLHLSSRLRGGNGAKAIFGNRHTTLHSIWDSLFLCKQICDVILKPESNDDYDVESPTVRCPKCALNDDYVSGILALISTVWSKEVSDWTKCETYQRYQESHIQIEFKEGGKVFFHSDKQPISSSERLKNVCPNLWVVQLNKLNCEFMWKGYDPPLNYGYGEFHDELIESKIMEKLLAMAGVRMAAIINSVLG